MVVEGRVLEVEEGLSLRKVFEGGEDYIGEGEMIYSWSWEWRMLLLGWFIGWNFRGLRVGEVVWLDGYLGR